jgi:hypothetical protein
MPGTGALEKAGSNPCYRPLEGPRPRAFLFAASSRSRFARPSDPPRRCKLHDDRDATVRAGAGPPEGAAIRRGDRAVAGDHGPDRGDGAQRDGGGRPDRPCGAARVPDRHDRRAVRVVRLRAPDALLQLCRLGLRARRRHARPAGGLLRGLRADGDLHAVHDRVGSGGRVVRPDVPRRHRRRERRLADPRARGDGVHRDLRARCSAWRGSRWP